MRWGVPVFVMISGALFLDPARSISIRKLYSKNILHLAGVLLFWSVCYAWSGFINYPPATVQSLFENIVLGRIHLWFVYMLLGLYVVVPLLRPICRDKKLLRYFWAVSLIFSFLIPTIVQVLTGLDLLMPNSLFSLGLQWLNRLLAENIRFHFTLEYVSYFVLGYFVYANSPQALVRKIIYVLGILGVVFAILFARTVSRGIAAPFDLNTQANMTLYVLFEALAVFVFVKAHIYQLPAKCLACFRHLSTCVFGIYLIHIGIQNELSQYLRQLLAQVAPWGIGVVFLVIVWGILIFLLSWIATEVIRKIPWINKYIL